MSQSNPTTPDPSATDPAPIRGRILVVDDQPEVREVIQTFLESAGFEVVLADAGRTAIEASRTLVFDAVVLDFLLPDMTGHEVVSELRSAGFTTPVLMLTGHSEDDLVSASLDSGADDFLTKPFAHAELESRLKALIRRGGYRGPFSVGTLRLDPLRHRAVIDGSAVRLTKVEFLILVTLVEARGDFVSREDLLKEVWQMDFDPGTNLVYTHVANLRNKLIDAGVEGVLQAERGRGYRVVME